jgi:hypothetical protein
MRAYSHSICPVSLMAKGTVFLKALAQQDAAKVAPRRHGLAKLV